MTIAQRALEYSNNKGISAADFERISGLANGMLKKLSDKTRLNTFKRIASAFPDLNIEWLRTGEGEMLNKIQDSPDSAKCSSTRKDSTEHLKAQYRLAEMSMAQTDKTIEMLNKTIEMLGKTIDMLEKTISKE